MLHNKRVFYLLSFTWGLPLTLIGCLVGLVLIIVGYKPKKYGHCLYFEVGENWGGLEFGPLFLVNKEPSEYIKMHEAGHGVQNCLFGPLMLVIVIMSAIRYWYRDFRKQSGNPCQTEYSDIWFEKQADILGEKYHTK